jgi:hypothetical protein
MPSTSGAMRAAAPLRSSKGGDRSLEVPAMIIHRPASSAVLVDRVKVPALRDGQWYAR